jgi:hypothetical protein
MGLCGVLNPPSCWDDVASLGSNEWREKSMIAYICRLVFGSSIYNIWRTKNTLRLDNNPATEEKLLRRIKREVKIWFTTKGKFHPCLCELIMLLAGVYNIISLVHITFRYK